MSAVEYAAAGVSLIPEEEVLQDRGEPLLLNPGLSMNHGTPSQGCEERDSLLAEGDCLPEIPENTPDPLQGRQNSLY